MAQMTVRINGHFYKVGCEDGQEAHLQAMAEEVDRRIGSLHAVIGPGEEAQGLVLAALLLADEVHDLKHEVNRLQSAAAQRERAAQAAAGAPRGLREREFARSLSRLANRAEEIAATLEHP
jgi:cell division protein ZapA